ncbi:acetyltransferase [Vibrio cholerae]|nr:acetyltransferase [Vibrio cholerae]EGR0510710.1 acetyltransferase [Vibrio cholerae]
MVTAVAFEFSVMRCQPLRRALAVPSINTKNSEFKWQLYIGILACFFLKRE